jgi:hypothetical protein
MVVLSICQQPMGIAKLWSSPNFNCEGAFSGVIKRSNGKIGGVVYHVYEK